MKKRFYIPLIAIIIGIIILFVVFSSRINKPSYLNIKSIPENTSNYLLIHNDLIVEGFSSYFLKHPLELTKFYKFFKKFKLINSSIDYGIILNEPTAIYFDNNTQSLNGIVKVKDSDYSIDKINGNLIEEDFKEIFSNTTYSTFVFNNKKYNQLYVILKYGEVNKDSLYFQLKNIILKSDTTNVNREIVEYYQENKKSILYKFQNLDILNSIGTSNLKGSIDLKNNRIDFLGTGKINEKFIFKNDVQLNSTNYGWAEFSGNFNTNQIPKTILKQIKMDRNLDGRIVLSIHQIKKIAKLLSKIDLNTFYNHLDLNILVGHQKLDSLAFDKENSEFNYSLNNEFKGFSMTNYPIDYSLKVEKNNFFQFFIDFEKMIAQNHDEWAWNGFKTFMKKMNFKKLDIICLEKNKTEFEIKGRLTSLDSSKNIVLNPFIY
jgi:hypothetical protein